MTCLAVTGLLPELAYHNQPCSTCPTVTLVGTVFAQCLPCCHPQLRSCLCICWPLLCSYWVVADSWTMSSRLVNVFIATHLWNSCTPFFLLWKSPSNAKSSALESSPRLLSDVFLIAWLGRSMCVFIILLHLMESSGKKNQEKALPAESPVFQRDLNLLLAVIVDQASEPLGNWFSLCFWSLVPEWESFW